MCLTAGILHLLCCTTAKRLKVWRAVARCLILKMMNLGRVQKEVKGLTSWGHTKRRGSTKNEDNAGNLHPCRKENRQRSR